MKDQTEERSSQLVHNLSNCEKKARKKFRLEQDSNPWPLRCQCKKIQAWTEFEHSNSKLRTNCEVLSSLWSFIRSSKYMFSFSVISYIGMRPHSPPTVSTEPTDIFRRELNGGGGGGGKGKNCTKQCKCHFIWGDIYSKQYPHLKI